ncbi:MAG TPA: S49 family peptidase, partial [Thermoanaerobaculia bacterium]|nr:S49 family peptidase [Thermoanaerobaculia bacterium]
TITSGPLKDTGSPFRGISEEERRYLQRIVGQLHGQFVRAVAAGRKGKLTEQEVAKLADGRIFTGEEARALELVDEIGNLDDAVALAGRLAGIKGKPGVIHPKKRRNELLELLTEPSDAQSLLQRIASRRLPRFLYRW